jgi:uncharacterized protein
MILENAALLVAVTLFAVGIAGCFLPILPGNILVWLGVIIHRFMAVDESVSWLFVGIATGLTLLAQVLDYLCTYWGARRFGATWQGAVGGIVGGILGVIFFNIPGLILGPIVGVVAVELYRSRDLRQASRAGIGTVVGGLIAFALKFGLACLVIAGFFMSLAGWF